jgi:NAD-dependent deacetylase
MGLTKRQGIVVNISILTGPGIIESNACASVSGDLRVDNLRNAGLTEFNERYYRSLSGWLSRPQAVLNHYNEQRRTLLSMTPSEIHYAIAALSQNHTVNLATFNTDNLHERAGTASVFHIQGMIMEARCGHPTHQCIKPLDYTTPMRKSDQCKHNRPYRPNVIFFEEEVTNYQHALTHLQQGELMLCIGCSDNRLLQAIVNEIHKSIPVHFPGNADALSALKNAATKDFKLSL